MSVRGRKPALSLAAVLVFMFVLLAAFVCAGIWYMQQHQRDATLNQAAQMSLDALDAYVGDMDRALESLEAYMHDFVYANSDINLLNRHLDSANRYRAKQRIAQTLEQIVRLSGTAECAWVYIPGGDEADYLSKSTFTGISNAELLAIREQIIGIIENKSGGSVVFDAHWTLIHTETTDYLLWLTFSKDVYYGAWVRVSHLHTKFSDTFSQMNGSSIILSTLAGETLAGADAGFQYVPGDPSWSIIADDLIGMTSLSSRTNVAISSFLPITGILRDMRVEFDFAMFAAGMVVFIFAAVFIFQVLIFRPFFSINRTLQDIAEGDLTLRFKKKSRLKEVAMLENSVNRLLDVIQDLKISVYETQLRARNVTCQYLNIRLKTHFYLNCLSIIHAMARVKNMELIKEMTVCLSHYLRFLDKDTDELVKLEDELSHVRNYARIQELRYPDMFQYIEDIPMELYDAKIPSLILQTFIENSVEHAMLYDKKNWVRLKANGEIRDALPGLRIQITDSGKGFDMDTLDMLGDKLVQSDFNQRHRIGIRNVISRLALIYDGKAAITFSNAEAGGASIDIWLPTTDSGQEDLADV